MCCRLCPHQLPLKGSFSWSERQLIRCVFVAHCLGCWENTCLQGTLFRMPSIRIGFLCRLWFMNIPGFTAVQPWTKPALFSISTGVKLPTAIGEGNYAEKGIVQGLYQMLMNILLTTWNTSGWKSLLEASGPAPFHSCLLSKSDYVAQDLVELSFENLEGGILRKLSANLFQCLTTWRPLFLLFKKRSVFIWPFSCRISVSALWQCLCWGSSRKELPSS